MNKCPVGPFFSAIVVFAKLLPIFIKSICNALFQIAYIWRCCCCWCYSSAVCRMENEWKNRARWIDLWKFGMQKQSNEFSIKCGKSIINSVSLCADIWSHSLLWKYQNSNCIAMNLFVIFVVIVLIAASAVISSLIRWWCSEIVEKSTNRKFFHGKIIAAFLFTCSGPFVHSFDWIDNSIHKYLLDFHMPEQRFLIKMHELFAIARHADGFMLLLVGCCPRQTLLATKAFWLHFSGWARSHRRANASNRPCKE